jgi:hypothetical protein
LATKGFDYKRDYQLITTNSAILCNLFYTKRVEILNATKSATDQASKYGYYFFDGFDAKDMFAVDPTDKGTGIFKRFTI